MKTLKQIREAVRTPERAIKVLDRISRMKKFRDADQGKAKQIRPLSRHVSHDELYKNRHFDSDNSGVQDIELNKLGSHQDSVDVHRVKERIKDLDTDKAITVFKKGGKHYVQDGNHRVAAHRLLGKKTIKAWTYGN
jgi:hypothetical protein